MFKSLVSFMGKQKRNYKVITLRNAFAKSVMAMFRSYRPLYIYALGADAMTLGLINSLQRAVSAASSIPTGWICDRYDLKKVAIAGLGMAVLGYLIYALANWWLLVIPAVILITLQQRFNLLTDGMILVDALKRDERSTGMSISSTIASIPSIITPMVAAFIVASYGGISVQGIRPILYIQIAAVLFLTIFLMKFLVSFRQRTGEIRSSGIIGHFRDVFKGGVALKRYLFLEGAKQFSVAMTMAFVPLFAVKVKGADPYILGAMTTAQTVVVLLGTIPFGRLGDRFGRKMMVFVGHPLRDISLILLVLAPNPWFLIVVGALQAFGQPIVGTTAWRVIAYELVSPEKRGRWIGVVHLCMSAAAATASFLSGVLWELLNPASIFLIAAAIDLLVVLPILKTVPETLRQVENP